MVYLCIYIYNYIYTHMCVRVITRNILLNVHECQQSTSYFDVKLGRTRVWFIWSVMSVGDLGFGVWWTIWDGGSTTNSFLAVLALSFWSEGILMSPAWTTWKVMEVSFRTTGCIGRGTNESCTRRTCWSVKQPARLWCQRNPMAHLRKAKRKRTAGVLVTHCLVLSTVKHVGAKPHV